MRRLEPFLVALIAGGLAILGGYLASRQAFRGERELREEQRAADARAAARVLDLELFNRLRLTLTGFGVAPPAGDIRVESVRAKWDCVIDSLDSELTAKPQGSAKCGRSVPPPDAATQLRPIAWSRQDRHLLAARIRGDRWFQITTAVDWWAMVTDSHGAVSALVQRARTSRRTAGTALEAMRSLTEARLALAPHVGLDG